MHFRIATVNQAELAGRLEVTHGAISKPEKSDAVRVSTLRQYLEAIGARLELVACSMTTTAASPPLGKDSAA